MDQVSAKERHSLVGIMQYTMLFYYQAPFVPRRVSLVMENDVRNSTDVSAMVTEAIQNMNLLVLMTPFGMTLRKLATILGPFRILDADLVLDHQVLKKIQK